MIINLSDNQKKAMKEAIHAYYLDERGEDIGILQQEGLFDLFMEQLAPIVYNAALDDAKYWYSTSFCQLWTYISADTLYGNWVCIECRITTEKILIRGGLFHEYRTCGT